MRKAIEKFLDPAEVPKNQDLEKITEAMNYLATLTDTKGGTKWPASVQGNLEAGICVRTHKKRDSNDQKQ